MLIDRDNSSLLVVDVQGRLLPAIHDWQRLLDNLVWLVKAAQRLGVPVLASEQYPQGLGPTVPELRTMIPDNAVVDKLHFSCIAAGCLVGVPGFDRTQIVVCGIESHVCVMQTALDLRGQGRDVFVVADAVASRNPLDRALALDRMSRAGIEIVSREMVLFEWLRRAGTDEFRQISTEFLR